MKLFRKKEQKASDFEIEIEDDDEGCIMNSVGM